MDNVLDVAQYMFDEYREVYGAILEETKLHKLLYFAQRETLAITGAPMFDEPFEAWVHGPVCRAVRSAYSWDGIRGAPRRPLSPANECTATEVVYRYGGSSASVLSEITHGETSWLRARSGIPADQRCTARLSVDDIKRDAEKAFPYDDDEDDVFTPDETADILDTADRIESGEMRTYTTAEVKERLALVDRVF